MSYGDIESDMYSIAQHAVANGYGKIEYLRAQPIALSSCVSTTASPRSASSPELTTRARGVSRHDARGGAHFAAGRGSGARSDAPAPRARARPPALQRALDRRAR